MENRTAILLLAIGSFVFCFLLILFQYRKDASQRIPFWIPAKFLQGLGSLLLFLHDRPPDFLTLVTAGNLLLLGCAYESWTMFYLVGRRVPTRLHLWVAVGIVVACLSSFALPHPGDTVLIFCLHIVFYVLPAYALLRNNNTKSILRIALGCSYLVLSLVFLANMLWNSIDFLYDEAVVRSLIGIVMPSSIYCMMLISGYSMLLLAKDRSDQDLKVAEASLRERDAQYRQIVDTAIEGIVSLDTEGCIAYANNQMALLLGCKAATLEGKKLVDFLTPDQRAAFGEQLRTCAYGEDVVSENCFVRADGSPYWLLVSAKGLMDDSGGYRGAFAMFTDIDARKRMEASLAAANSRLAALNRLDGLTSIANRRHFDTVLAEECLRHARTGEMLSLILVDIDHFKTFNDTYGHVDGDTCLRRVATTLASTVNRPGDLVARYGGEEFACILPMTDFKGACGLAERMRQAVAALAIPHVGHGQEHVTASFGVLTTRCHESEAVSGIVATVDKLLYQAKSAGRNCVKGLVQEEGAVCPGRSVE